MAKRWKREPRPTGLAGVCCGEMGSSLTEDGVELAYTIHRKGHGDSQEGWGWVACDNPAYGVRLKNEYLNPFETEAEAKTAAKNDINSCEQEKRRLG